MTLFNAKIINFFINLSLIKNPFLKKKFRHVKFHSFQYFQNLIHLKIHFQLRLNLKKPFFKCLYIFLQSIIL